MQGKNAREIPLALYIRLEFNNYLHINNPRARNEILEYIIEEDRFLDINRILHEEKREYTWSRKNPVRKQARLDFFFISFECLCTLM